MKSSYSVSIDRSRGLLRLVLGGFFDLDTVAQFAAERDDAVRRLGRAPNQHVTLCDIRTQMISAPPVTAAFQQMIGDPRFSSRRLAFVVSGALEKLQTRRTASLRDDVGYFNEVADAEAWLTEREPADVRPKLASTTA